jgi:glycosyltransferase involved in cell wall biosynthesis
MLKTGKYQFVSFGGAIKHPDHTHKKLKWGEDWVIWPVDGYGNPDMVRAMIHQQKPDILWFMTDPRFYGGSGLLRTKFGPMFQWFIIMFGTIILIQILILNISDAEGFGLATLESMAAGTPIIVTMTGGLQDQVTDGENWYGIGLEPASKAIIGSQQVPYIYEDRINKEDFINALTEMYEKTSEERTALGASAREWTQKQFNFEDFVDRWDTLFTDIHDRLGSWDTRTGYTPYEMRTF